MILYFPSFSVCNTFAKLWLLYGKYIMIFPGFFHPHCQHHSTPKQLLLKYSQLHAFMENCPFINGNNSVKRYLGDYTNNWYDGTASCFRGIQISWCNSQARATSGISKTLDYPWKHLFAYLLSLSYLVSHTFLQFSPKCTPLINHLSNNHP